MTLQDQIKAVHLARERANTVKAFLDTERAEWETSHAATIANLRALTEGVGVAEAVLREMTLQAYAADPTNKKPAPGVGIQDNPDAFDLSYEPAVAVNWAIDHQHITLLTVKPQDFEKVALAIKPAFVQFTKTPPKATIATDLSKFVDQVT